MNAGSAVRAEQIPGEVLEIYEQLPGWHVLWTHSNCEYKVHEQLLAKGYEVFLPTTRIWTKRRGVRCYRNLPLFPGYLFLRNAMDKDGYLDICKVRGLVKLLGRRWDQLAVVPEAQIGSIQKVVHSDLPAVPRAYLRDGQKVRITGGPLAEVEGILLGSRLGKGLLVLSIEMLHRSIAVEVDCTWVVAA